MSYTNSDGLFVITKNAQGAVRDNGLNAQNGVKTMVFELKDATKLGTSDVNPQPNDAFIPAGSYITKASLVVTTAFASGGSATLSIGLQQADGTIIDADGIDATVAVAALAANKAVVANGALVGGTATIGAANGYMSVIYGTAAFTAGAAKLVIEYIEV
tara:strand:+ start:2377 stop:2853 length:477 start_codon:yes stop_codon:yes gene_type:complete